MFNNIQKYISAYPQYEMELARLNVKRFIFIILTLIIGNTAAIFLLPNYFIRLGWLSWIPFAVFIPAVVFCVRAKNSLEHAYKILNKATAFIALFILLWAATIAVMSIHTENHAIILVSVIFIVSFIVYIKPVITLFNYTSMFLFFILYYIYSINEQEIVNILLLKIFVFTTIAISISISLFVLTSSKRLE